MSTQSQPKSKQPARKPAGKAASLARQVKRATLQPVDPVEKERERVSSMKRAAALKGVLLRAQRKAAIQRGEVTQTGSLPHAPPDQIEQLQRRAIRAQRKLLRVIEQRLQKPDDLTPTGVRTLATTVNAVNSSLKTIAQDIALARCPRCSTPAAASPDKPVGKTWAEQTIDQLNRFYARQEGKRYRHQEVLSDPREDGEQPDLSTGPDFLDK